MTLCMYICMYPKVRIYTWNAVMIPGVNKALKSDVANIDKNVRSIEFATGSAN